MRLGRRLIMGAPREQSRGGAIAHRALERPNIGGAEHSGRSRNGMPQCAGCLNMLFLDISLLSYGLFRPLLCQVRWLWLGLSFLRHGAALAFFQRLIEKAPVSRELWWKRRI